MESIFSLARVKEVEAGIEFILSEDNRIDPDVDSGGKSATGATSPEEHETSTDVAGVDSA